MFTPAELREVKDQASGAMIMPKGKRAPEDVRAIGRQRAIIVSLVQHIETLNVRYKIPDYTG